MVDRLLVTAAPIVGRGILVGVGALIAGGLGLSVTPAAAQDHAPAGRSTGHTPVKAEPKKAPAAEAGPATPGGKGAARGKEAEHHPEAHDTHAAPAKPSAVKPQGPEAPGRASAPGHASAPAAAGRAKPTAPTSAKSTVHDDDDTEHAAAPQPAKAAATPARSRELDAVMERINRRIAGGPAKASASAAPRRDAHAGAPAPAAKPVTGGHGLAAPRPGSAFTSATVAMPRVRLTWRPAVVWPGAVLDDTRDRVDVAWAPGVQ